MNRRRLIGLHVLFGWLNLALAVPGIYLMFGMPLVMRQYGWSGTEIGLFQLAGLPADALNKLPSQLSGGMRKRAGLARALALDPPLLFLDEPTAGLDPIGAAAFDRLIKTLQEALGLTVFLITHDLDTLYAICDRVAVLADRRVLVNAPLAEVEKFDHPWVQEYFHGPRGRAAQAARAKEA